MTGAREESELTGKGEEARMKARQIAFVFGHGRGQVVVNQVTRNATQRLKCVNMTAHECFEALAVRELDVHHAAVTFHQREGVQLALIAGSGSSGGRSVAATISGASEGGEFG